MIYIFVNLAKYKLIKDISKGYDAKLEFSKM